jgi:hypothetical protein
MKRAIFVLMILLLASLACALPNIAIAWPTEPPGQPPVVTQAPATQPTEQPPVVTQPPATQTPIQPTATLPIAIAIVQAEHAAVNIYSLNSQLLAEIGAAGLENAGPESVHIAGRLAPTYPAVAYFTYSNGGQIMLNTNEQIAPLVNAPNFASMLGAPGQPILSYSTAEFGQTALRSQLFVSPIDTLFNAGPAVSLDDPEGRAIKPLAIHVDGGVPTGVWYTLRPWGIGGDIVFDPTEGLYYVNISNGTITEYNDNVSRSASMSFDQVWAANARGIPGNGTFHIYNLQTAENYGFNPLPSSERGAGYGVFSPSNQYVAWMEGSGWTMAETPNFHATIRVGTTGGVWLVDYPDTMLASLLGSAVAWAEPVGWLDDQRLVLQIRGTDWRDASVVVMDITTNYLTYLTAGMFVGLVYP